MNDHISVQEKEKRIRELAVYYRLKGLDSGVIAFKLQKTPGEIDRMIAEYGGYVSGIIPHVHEDFH